MSGQHWNVFGHCPTCKALPGKPCGDMRTTGKITKRAHHNREQLAEPLPIKEVGADA